MSEENNLGNQMAHMRGEFSGLKEVVTVRFDNLTETLHNERAATNKTAELLKKEVDHTRNAVKQLDLATVALLKEKADQADLLKLEAELKLKAYQSAHDSLRHDFDNHVKEEALALQGRIEKYDAIIKSSVKEATEGKLEAKDWRFVAMNWIVFGFVAMLLSAVGAFGVWSVIKTGDKDERPAVVQQGHTNVVTQPQQPAPVITTQR